MTSARPSSRWPCPPTPTAWTGFVAERVESQLAAARRDLDLLKDGTAAGRACDVLELWNAADTAVRNAQAVVSVLTQVHPAEDVRTGAEHLRAGGRQVRHRPGPGPRAVRRARRGGRRRARRRRAPAAAPGAARLPPQRRRPRRGDARPAARTVGALDRRRAGLLAQHPRRRAQHPDRARPPRRHAAGLHRRAPGRRGRAGHDHDRLPRHGPVPHVRARLRRPAPNSSPRS